MLKAYNYFIFFHEHKVSFTWSKSHLHYATDASSVKSTGISCLMVPSPISGGMRCVLTWASVLAGSPPYGEKFFCGDTRLLEGSPKDSWEGALTCSLLTSLCFQESGKQGEGLRLGMFSLLLHVTSTREKWEFIMLGYLIVLIIIVWY